jgi:hypothetical protein
MRSFLLLGFVLFAGCDDADTDGTGGAGAASSTTSTSDSATSSGSTSQSTSAASTSSASSSSGSGGGADVTLPDNQLITVALIWTAAADAAPGLADLDARVGVYDPTDTTIILPAGSVTIGNGADDFVLPHDPMAAPPYQLQGPLAYTNELTFDVMVDGEHGFGVLDLGHPWIEDFAVALPAVAASEIALTWTPTADATCRIQAFEQTVDFTSDEFPDVGHFEIPAGELDQGQETITLNCFRAAYGSDNLVVFTTQLRRLEVTIE